MLHTGQAGPAHSLLPWLCTLHRKSLAAHEAASDIPKCSLFMVSAFVLRPFKQLGNHLLNSRAICPWHLIYQSPTFPERWSLVTGFWGTGQVPLCAHVKMEWDSGKQFSLNLSAFITILLSSASSDLWPVFQKQWRPAAQTDQLSEQTYGQGNILTCPCLPRSHSWWKEQTDRVFLAHCSYPEHSLGL